MSLSTLSVRYQFQDLGSSQARGELVSLPMRAYISLNHRKARRTMQPRSTRIQTTETSPTPPGVLPTHLLDRQTKPPSPKTTLVPLARATMRCKITYQPTLQRKSSARTRTSLRTHQRRRRERERPRQARARGSSPMPKTNSTTTDAPKTPALRGSPVGLSRTRCRIRRPKPTRRSPSSLCRHPNVWHNRPPRRSEYPSTVPYCSHLESSWAQATPPRRQWSLMTSSVNLFKLSRTCHYVPTVRLHIGLYSPLQC